MVHASRAIDLVKKFGVAVLSPGYRLALIAPYLPRSTTAMPRSFT